MKRTTEHRLVGQQEENKANKEANKLTTSASVPFLHSLEPEGTFLSPPLVCAVSESPPLESAAGRGRRRGAGSCVEQRAGEWLHVTTSYLRRVIAFFQKLR